MELMAYGVCQALTINPGQELPVQAVLTLPATFFFLEVSVMAKPAVPKPLTSTSGRAALAATGPSPSASASVAVVFAGERYIRGPRNYPRGESSPQTMFYLATTSVVSHMARALLRGASLLRFRRVVLHSLGSVSVGLQDVGRHLHCKRGLLLLEKLRKRLKNVVKLKHP